MAAVPSIGRAVRVEGAPAPEADLTRALYEQYANQIFRYCVHQLGSREEAEDAVQSTFLNAFRGIKRGVVPELESAWLFKIAHNVCLSRRRTSWRRGRIESPTDFDVVEEMTPAPSRRSDELIGLQDVLEQMPDNQRRAILLREWQGLSYREIAEELELSQAAVETLIFRARRSLAAGLEQPPEAKKRKLVRGADLGNLLAGIKSLLVGGGAAAKIAATVAVVSAGTVVAAAPVQQHRAHSHRPTAPAASQAVSTAPVSSRSSVAGPAAVFPAAGSEHGAPAAGQLEAAHFATLGSVSDGTLSSPDDSPAVAPPVEPVPAATPPAVAPPEQVVPQPAADTPHQATPTSAPNDRSKSESGTTPSPKGGDSQGNGTNGTPKGHAPEGSATPPPAVTPTVQPGGSAPSTGTDSKGTDSKGTDSKGSDAKGNGDKADDSKKAAPVGATPPASGAVPAPDATTQPGNGDAKKGDSDKKNASTDTSPPAPAASVPPPASPSAPDPAAPAAVMSVLANGGAPGPAAAGDGKSKDKPKDSGKGNDK